MHPQLPGAGRDCWIVIQDVPDGCGQLSVRAQEQARGHLFGAGVQFESRAAAAKRKAAAFVGGGNDPCWGEQKLLAANLNKLEQRVRRVIDIGKGIATDAHDNLLSQASACIERETFEPPGEAIVAIDTYASTQFDALWGRGGRLVGVERNRTHLSLPWRVTGPDAQPDFARRGPQQRGDNAAGWTARPTTVAGGNRRHILATNLLSEAKNLTCRAILAIQIARTPRAFTWSTNRHTDLHCLMLGVRRLFLATLTALNIVIPEYHTQPSVGLQGPFLITVGDKQPPHH